MAIITEQKQIFHAVSFDFVSQRVYIEFAFKKDKCLNCICVYGPVEKDVCKYVFQCGKNVI